MFLDPRPLAQAPASGQQRGNSSGRGRVQKKQHVFCSTTPRTDRTTVWVVTTCRERRNVRHRVKKLEGRFQLLFVATPWRECIAQKVSSIRTAGLVQISLLARNGRGTVLPFPTRTPCLVNRMKCRCLPSSHRTSRFIFVGKMIPMDHKSCVREAKL